MAAKAQRRTGIHHRRSENGGSSGYRNVGTAERVASVLDGGVLGAFGLRRKDWAGAALALVGGYLVERGATGHCMAYDALGVTTAREPGRFVKQHGPEAVLDASTARKVEHTVVIRRPREELYRFWRNLENLPRVMSHLERVRVLSPERSHWTAKAPAGRAVEWDAVIINEIENELIAWKSVEDADVPNAGSVHFADAPRGRGTEVTVVLEYEPPAGGLGAAVAKLFGEEPDVQVRDDLRRFKQTMESGDGAAAAGVG
jgi:uncharacterized membrane protein